MLILKLFHIIPNYKNTFFLSSQASENLGYLSVTRTGTYCQNCELLISIPKRAKEQGRMAGRLQIEKLPCSFNRNHVHGSFTVRNASSFLPLSDFFRERPYHNVAHPIASSRTIFLHRHTLKKFARNRKKS